MADKSIFQLLTKAMKRPAVIRGYDTTIQTTRPESPIDKSHEAIMARQFGRIAYDLYQRSVYYDTQRMASYLDFEVMEYCCIGTTKIATPEGFITIAELAEKGCDHEFITYAYDHNLKRLIPAKAYNAHKTRDEHVYKVTFDSGESITCTADHRLMLRDGTFKRVKDLQPGDSMMPFYRKDSFYKEHHYNHIYSCNSKIGYHGWVSEHNMIAEWVNNRKIERNEIVHHINYNGKDNRPENLMIMDRKEHQRYHAEINNQKNWNNPVIREKLLVGCAKGGKITSQHHKEIGTNKGKNNYFYFHIPFDNIVEAAKDCVTEKATAAKLGVSYRKLQRDIVANGYNDWHTFLTAYGIKSNKYSSARGITFLNHKVVSVEYAGFEPVYDLTVPGYKNFATDTVISHNTPEIAATLDIYADECLTSGYNEKLLEIKSENSTIKDILSDLFYNRLQIETKGWHVIRNLVKYGDNFMAMDVDDRIGVTDWIQLPVAQMQRQEAYDGDIQSVRFVWQQGNLQFDNWQILHFRLLGNDARLPYGTAMLEPARKIWKQLTLAEDAMLIYRITRAPERRIFYIDVGNIEPEAVEEFMQKVKNEMKRSPAIQPGGAGNIDLKVNPMTVDEDFFMPVRGDVRNTIDTLPGASNLDEIADIEYLQQKLFSALKVPKAYLNYSDEVAFLGDGTLAQKDMRFARTINRIQNAFLNELKKIALVHLYVLNYKEDLTNFELKLTNPSTQYELQKLQLLSERASVFSSMWDPSEMSQVSYVWACRTILGMNDSEIKRNMEQQYIEKGLRNKISKASEGEDNNILGGEVSMSEPDIGVAAEEGLSPLGQEVASEKGITDGFNKLFGKSDDSKRKIDVRLDTYRRNSYNLLLQSFVDLDKEIIRLQEKRSGRKALRG